MALTEVTTTFNLHDYFGDNFDPRRAKAWATTNADDQKIDDTSTGETRLGGGTAVIAADGTGTFVHWAPGADANPASWQTTYHFDVPDRTQKSGRRTKSFGPYTVTSSGFLTTLEEEQEIPPTYLTQVTAQLDAIRDDAQASEDATAAHRAAVEAVVITDLGTTDGQTKTLIETDGTLTKAALSATIAAGVGPARRLAGVPTTQGAVVLSFDDGYPCWANDFLPAFAERGQRATFSVQSGIIGTAGRISAAEVQALHAAGHEISAHSVTHPQMASSTAAQRADEFGDCKTALEALVGAGQVTNFVYPYGSRDFTTDREALYRFNTVWQSSTFRSTIRREDAYNAFSLRRQQWTRTSHASILQDVRAAAVQPIFVPIYMHAIKDEANWAPAGTEPSEAMFLELIDLAYELGVPLITTREAFAGATMLVNPDFETGDTRGWIDAWSGGSGTKTIETVTPPDGIGGTQAVKLVTADATKQMRVAQDVFVTPGRTYTFSILCRKVSLDADVGSVQIRVRPYSWDDKLAPLGSYTQASVALGAGDTGWVTASVDYTAPADASRARIDFGIANRYCEFYVKRVHWGPKEFGAFA